MANPAHLRLAATATRLIKKNGRAAELVQTVNTGPSYDPEQSEVATPVVIVQTSFDASEINGSLVQEGDLHVLMDSSVKPTGDMRLRDGGIDYSIIPINQIRPGEVEMLYKVGARI